MSSGYVHGSIRRSAKYSVEYPTLPSISDTLPDPESIQIIQNQFSHDIAVLTFPVLNYAAMTLLKTGVPVSISWTKENLTRYWVGYVSFISSEHSVGPRKRVEVHCIGASFPLKNRKPRVFKAKTIPQVVETLAKEANLKFVGDSHPRIFDQVNIAGQSYWEWICANAKKIGFGVVVDGTTLYFKAIDKLLDMYSGDSPMISYFQNDLPTDTMFVDRTLDYFKVMNGEYIEGGHLRNEKHVGGVDPLTGKAVVTKNKPNKVGKNTRVTSGDVFFEEQNTEHVIHDSVSATAAVNGAAHLARFTTPAKVRCQGDVRIKPFGCVIVNGITEDLDGNWLVVSTKHFLNINGEYQIEMQIATDGTGKNNDTPTRTTNSSEIGTIDIAAALENGGVPVTAPVAKNSKIKLSKPIHKETKQGFNRTPAKWVAPPPSTSKSRKGKK